MSGASKGRRVLPVLTVLSSDGVDVTAPRERADAAANRHRVLDAAARLFAEHGVAPVTMDDIAARAGVGKGTLYRRYADKGHLAAALLDEREHELQARMLDGPGPLGPHGGDSPTERLAAFVRAYLTFLDASLDLVLTSETAGVGARHATGAYAFWRTHCVLLLRAAGAPDPDLRAEVLLAALAAEQVRHWRHRPPAGSSGLPADGTGRRVGNPGADVSDPAHDVAGTHADAAADPVHGVADPAQGTADTPTDDVSDQAHGVADTHADGVADPAHDVAGDPAGGTSDPAHDVAGDPADGVADALDRLVHALAGPA